jgi:hypothetical protein
MKSHIMAAAIVGLGGVALISAHSAHAERGLAVGTCVVADKLHPGRIMEVRPYAYSVKGFGPNDTPMIWPFDDVVPGACPADAPPAPQAFQPPQQAQRPRFVQAPVAPPPAGGGGACFANDAVQEAGLDGRVRAVLVNGFSHRPNPGEDGSITVHIDSLRLGVSRRATEVDAVQYQTVAGRPVYDVRVTFETCTDYNRRDVFVRRDRNFVCFTKASGVFDCSMTANSPGLAEDQTREVPK